MIGININIMIYNTLRESLEKMSFKQCSVGGMKDVEKDQLHNFQGSMQNDNAGLLFQKVLRFSRWWQQSFKANAGFL